MLFALSRQEVLNILTAIGCSHVETLTERRAIRRLRELPDCMDTSLVDGLRTDRMTKENIQRILKDPDGFVLEKEDTWPTPNRRKHKEESPRDDDSMFGELEVRNEEDSEELPEYRGALEIVAKEIVRRSVKKNGRPLTQEDNKAVQILSEITTVVQLIHVPEAVMNHLGWGEQKPVEDGGLSGV